MKRSNQIGGVITASDPIEDKVTKARIERHLSDPNDKITEEDLQNIRTEFLPPTNTISTEPQAEAEYQAISELTGRK